MLLAAFTCVVLVGMAACAPRSPTQAGTQPSPPATPPRLSTPSPSPAVAIPAQVPAPTTIAVTFGGLPHGFYPTHLHSRCSGLQGFHITVLQRLVVGADGVGSIQVPSSYFGRGLCVIVYSSPSLSGVLSVKWI